MTFIEEIGSGCCEVSLPKIYPWGGFGCSPACALRAAAVQVRARDFPRFSFLAHHALGLHGCMKSWERAHFCLRQRRKRDFLISIFAAAWTGT
jgi:hypothetical protein